MFCNRHHIVLWHGTPHHDTTQHKKITHYTSHYTTTQQTTTDTVKYTLHTKIYIVQLIANITHTTNTMQTDTHR